MRVLHVLHQRVGGVRSHVEALSTALNELNIASVILTDDSSTSWLSQRRFTKRLRSRSNIVDVVHAHGFRAAWQCSQLRGVKWIYTAHTAGIEKPPSLVERLNSAAAGVAISHSLCEELQAARVERLRVNPGGILVRERFPTKLDAREKLGLNVDDKVVSGLGRMTADKGFDDLLHAMQEVWYEHEDAKLILSGDGPEKDKLMDIIEGLVRRENVRILPRQNDPFTLYAASDLFVMPSRVEALGLAAIEALSASVPVVARRIGGLAELVEDGVCGKLVAPDDYLGDVIADLLFAPTLLKTMGDAGRLRVIERFDMRKNAETIAQIYQECA